MGKLISEISNYPIPSGSVALAPSLLTEGGFRFKDRDLADYLRQLLDRSRNIHFFGPDGTSTNRWYDLLQQSSIFQLARFQGIKATELLAFFNDLALSNGFTANASLSQAELQTLAYQKLQIIQYLFAFYKTVCQNINDENKEQVASILLSNNVKALYVRYQGLLEECTQAPALVQAANRKAVANFGSIAFAAIDKGTTEQLEKYYNTSGLPSNQALGIYSNTEDQLKAANELAYGIFAALMQIHLSFSTWAASRTEYYAYGYNSHEPHIALLLAYVKMQLLFDERFNQLAAEQSSYIFENILQLPKQKVIADKAYVSLELAKNVTEYLVAKGSLFKAGKNSLNQPVYYSSHHDLVLNAAKIQQISSCVRLYRNGSMYAVSATTDASHTEWQANDAWLAFNDLSEAYTGLAFESTLLGLLKKGDSFSLEISFNTDLPDLPADLADKIQLCGMQEDGTEAPYVITAAGGLAQQPRCLTISAKLDKDLKTLTRGINARLKLISPAKTEQDDELFVVLYRYLLSETIGNFKVKVNQAGFVPSSVNTTSGVVDGATSFVAFGTRSAAGSSFRIAHPFLPFAAKTDLTIHWAEPPSKNVSVTINGQDHTLSKNQPSSTISDLASNYTPGLRVRLASSLSYTQNTSINSDSGDSTMSTQLPMILSVTGIDLVADLEELIYQDASTVVKFSEYYRKHYGYIKSLRLPFADKRRQKDRIRERIVSLRLRYLRERKNNALAMLYPLGQLNTEKDSGLCMLPDYTQLGYGSYEAELCIGLSAIVPGQSISLLFDIADETAEQTEREAKITWHIVEQETISAMDASKIVDSTAGFLQTGLVQLSLPETASASSEIMYGNNCYWLLARCQSNYDVVANIKKISVNGLELSRIIDDKNKEAKVSVPAGTIENLYPKVSQIKSLSHNTPSMFGREEESNAHYWWRSSQRLRHKSRGITPWDLEQLVLENFSYVYKVKCFNHAYYDTAGIQIVATPAHSILCLLPHMAAGGSGTNLQPALQVSKLLAIQAFLASKSSAHLQLQVLNTQWDEVLIQAEVVLADGILDIPFYKNELDQALKKFLAPWAYESVAHIAPSQKIYMATLVDYIDELAYVDHIRALKVLKNNIEVVDEISTSTPLHLLTTAAEHSLTVHLYAD